LLDIFRICKKQPFGVEDTKVSDYLTGRTLLHELEEVIAGRLFEQSCPDGVLASSGKTTETVEKIWLDKDGIDEGAKAEEYRENLRQKDSLKPRVGLTEGEINQDRCRSCEKDEIDVIEHFETILVSRV